MNISGCNKTTARRCLKASKGSLTRALDSFYAEGGTNANNDSPVIARPKRRKISPTASMPENAIEVFFNQYKSTVSGDIEPEGLTKLCADLRIDPLDAVWLCIATECQAKTMGIFTLQEWSRGMNAIDAVDIKELNSEVHSLRNRLKKDTEYFKKVYVFSFTFSLEPGARNISLETAVQLWDIVLPFSGWKLYQKWLDFTRATNGKAITRDIWTQLLVLIEQVPDLEALDAFDRDNGAWPVMIDEFFDHITHK